MDCAYNCFQTEVVFILCLALFLGMCYNEGIMVKNLKEKFFSLSAFVLLMFVLNFCYSVLDRIRIGEEQSRYRYIARNQANYIASCIDKVVVRTYTLREMVNENDGGYEFFDKVADTIRNTVLMDTGITLKNLTLAPDGIVKKVFPVEGNEAFFGFDFTDESKPGNKEAIESYKMAKTVLTNPFNLVQGGFGMASRTPVFINKNGKTEFWGLVSATMDFDDLLNSFKFENFEKININYKLWYEDENGNVVVLHKSKNENLKNSITEEIKIYNLRWNLDLSLEKNWINKNLSIIIRITICLVAFLFALLILMLFRIRRDGDLMRTLAEQDNLTKCYSRYYLNSIMLDVEDGSWKEENSNYSLAIVDVDYFKQVNDKYGHFSGDRALIAIARILLKSVKSSKKHRVIRFGGDEFLLFYDAVTKKELETKLKTLLSEVNSFRFDDLPELKLSVSVGAAVATENCKSYQALMKKADENLYKVKENGRNSFILS